eukprot:CAMPEP_0179000286 /NCGR_PEP_ID=MMETSP0795-20121207/10572_1 /TAXON_ID=88552 /ORGANISM="Amoebophrya sp., Strain Ameob2" /LENGTH=1198 /DNA_ID=CAMNT_0020693235 /DNA_START=263 /DNA_END=3859 /DNA_ORIENTATION=-
MAAQSYPWIDVPVIDLDAFSEPLPPGSSGQHNSNKNPNSPSTAFDFFGNSSSYLLSTSVLSSTSTSTDQQDRAELASKSEALKKRKKEIGSKIAAASAKYGSFWVDVRSFARHWDRHIDHVPNANKQVTDEGAPALPTTTTTTTKGSRAFNIEGSHAIPPPVMYFDGEHRMPPPSGEVVNIAEGGHLHPTFSPPVRAVVGSGAAASEVDSAHSPIPNEEPTPDIPVAKTSPIVHEQTGRTGAGAAARINGSASASVAEEYSTSYESSRGGSAGSAAPVGVGPAAAGGGPSSTNAGTASQEDSLQPDVAKETPQEAAAAEPSSPSPFSFDSYFKNTSFDLYSSSYTSSYTSSYPTTNYFDFGLGLTTSTSPSTKDYFASDPFANAYGSSSATAAREESPLVASGGAKTASGTTEEVASSARKNTSTMNQMDRVATATTTTQLHHQEQAATPSVAESTAAPVASSAAASAASSFAASASTPSGGSSKGYSRDAVVDAVIELFDVHESEKTLNAAFHQPQRGYIGHGAESGSKDFFENKEGFSYGYSDWADPSESLIMATPRTFGGTSSLGPATSTSSTRTKSRLPQNEMEGHNVWPRSLPANTVKLLEKQLFDIFIAVGEALVRAYSLVLYEDENFLPEKWAGGETISLARVFHYFSNEKLKEQDRVRAEQEKEQVAAAPWRKKNTAQTTANSTSPSASATASALGSSPHTDWGLLTLICADDVPGLQLFIDGCYHTVKPRFHDNLLFVNCGDFMSLLSCGKFFSPLHRVLSPGEITRGVGGDGATDDHLDPSPAMKASNLVEGLHRSYDEEALVGGKEDDAMNNEDDVGAGAGIGNTISARGDGGEEEDAFIPSQQLVSLTSPREAARVDVGGIDQLAPLRSMSGILNAPGGDLSDVAPAPDSRSASLSPPRKTPADKAELLLPQKTAAEAQTPTSTTSSKPPRDIFLSRDKLLSSATPTGATSAAATPIVEDGAGGLSEALVAEETTVEPAEGPSSSSKHTTTSKEQLLASVSSSAKSGAEAMIDAESGYWFHSTPVPGHAAGLKITEQMVELETPKAGGANPIGTMGDLQLFAETMCNKDGLAKEDEAASLSPKPPPLLMPAATRTPAKGTNATRLRQKKADERFSVVFFYYPNFEAQIPEPPQSAARQMYSVFTDQSEECREQYQSIVGSIGSFAAIRELSFGSWIKRKWESVARK